MITEEVRHPVSAGWLWRCLTGMAAISAVDACRKDQIEILNAELRRMEEERKVRLLYVR